jgi:hypothetical protein
MNRRWTPVVPGEEVVLCFDPLTDGGSLTAYRSSLPGERFVHADLLRRLSSQSWEELVICPCVKFDPDATPAVAARVELVDPKLPTSPTTSVVAGPGLFQVRCQMRSSPKTKGTN